MEKENSEMSLDDVLSSIKKMVIDEEPPVFDLTEKVCDDGSIVSLKAGAADSGYPKEKKDMSAFLKLIQEDTSSFSASPNLEEALGNTEDQKANKGTSGLPSRITRKEASSDRNSDTVFQDIILEMTEPLIKDWLKSNLATIVKTVVETEVRNFLHQKRRN